MNGAQLSAAANRRDRRNVLSLIPIFKVGIKKSFPTGLKHVPKESDTTVELEVGLFEPGDKSINKPHAMGVGILSAQEYPAHSGKFTVFDVEVDEDWAGLGVATRLHELAAEYFHKHKQSLHVSDDLTPMGRGFYNKLKQKGRIGPDGKFT